MRILTLSIEIRDVIWKNCIDDCPKTIVNAITNISNTFSRYRRNASDWEDDHYNWCTRHLHLTVRRFPYFTSRTSLLLIDIDITCDVEQYLYAKLKTVRFCGGFCCPTGKCIINYLNKTKVLGPLRWTRSIKFLMEDSKKAKAGQGVATSLGLLTQRMKATHITLRGVDDSAGWSI